MITTSNKAVLLLSGGLDSSTTAAIAVSQGFECHGLTFSYGQRHRQELTSAGKVASSLKLASHKIIELDAGIFGGSALTDKELEVPKANIGEQRSSAIPITYVPVRNLVFLSFAAAFAESIGAFAVFIGVNCCDYSGYPDCRPEFIKSFNETLNLAAAASVKGEGRFEVHTPIIEMSKAEIIKTGSRLGMDYSLTHSCYCPDESGLACGECDSCRLRLAGFAKAGLKDPLEYAK